MPVLEKIKLTQENYYNPETDWQYMSFSIFKNFLINPAAALASLNGEYEWFENKTPLLVGNYLHSYFESPEAHQAFIDEHPEIISSRGVSKGQLKKEYQQAQKMIDRIEKENSVINLLANTEREVIVQGEIDGVDWKGKVDVLNTEKGYFIDFKTVAMDLSGDCKEWTEEHTKDHFIYNRKYHMQMAIYQELLRQQYGKHFQVIIVAVEKSDNPMVRLFSPEQNRMDFALETVKREQGDILKIINGELKPELLNDGSRYYKEHHRIDEIEVV